MKCILLSLFLMFPLTSLADSNAAPQSIANKAMIESFDLESQTITLHGQTYHFAQGAVILDANDLVVGFTGLSYGQIVEFKTSSGSIQSSSSESKVSENNVTEIKILSDNRKQDEVH